ncbi:unnamed protein product, partial [Ixodes pacificus]
MMAGGWAAPAPASQEEEEGSGVAQVKTAFTVKLVKFEDSKKIQLIKELKNLMEGINLVQVTVPLPQVVR